MTVGTQKQKMLIERLYEKTLESKLSWEYEPAVDYLTVRVSKHFIELEESTNLSGDILYNIIIRSDGEVIDRFSDETLGNEIPDIGEYASYFEIMRDMREIALRQAKGMDRVIDEIIVGLDNI